MRVEEGLKLDFKDVLIRPRRSELSSRSEVELVLTYNFKNSKQAWSGVPIMVANMDTTGTFEIAQAVAEAKIITCMHKHYSPDDWTTWVSGKGASCAPYVAVSAGTSDADKTKVRQIFKSCPDVPFICLDVANGYSEAFGNTVRKYREEFPQKTIIAGNVVTADMTDELLRCGADIVKVGIGPGSVCTTRKQTGVGYPQLSAIAECAEAAHAIGGHVVGDGGCTCPGDFAKAFGAGGDFVMTGGMFAGHDESGGELVTAPNGLRFKSFYGMSSTVAMGKYAGGVANYRSSEGKAITVPYRGPVMSTVTDLLGGIRSACTYVGARNLCEMERRVIFVRTNVQLNEIFGKDEKPPVAPELNNGNGENCAKRAKLS
jgi:GMP reductase